jgi:peptidoglycan-associated lipoprotein
MNAYFSHKILLCLVLVVLFLPTTGCAKKVKAKPAANPPVASVPPAPENTPPGGDTGKGISETDKGGSKPTRPEGDYVDTPFLKDVFFDYDKSELKSEGRRALEENANWLKKNPQARILIEGHCDERGTEEYNEALGERRALATKSFLINLGISGDRIATISYGELRPFDTGHSEEAWSQNRRAHFKVSSEKVSMKEQN